MTAILAMPCPRATCLDFVWASILWTWHCQDATRYLPGLCLVQINGQIARRMLLGRGQQLFWRMGGACALLCPSALLGPCLVWLSVHSLQPSHLPRCFSSHLASSPRQACPRRSYTCSAGSQHDIAWLCFTQPHRARLFVDAAFTPIIPCPLMGSRTMCMPCGRLAITL